MLDKVSVLYLEADRAKRCNQCVMFLSDTQECNVFAEKVSGKDGVCGLWIGGEPSTSEQSPARALTTKREAGYVEHPGGTSCGSCRWGGQSVCRNECLRFPIDNERGCCNAWEPSKKAREAVRAELLQGARGGEVRGWAVEAKDAGGHGSEKHGGVATADPHELAKDEGVTYNGVQHNQGIMPDFHMFTDPAHGSTFVVKGELTKANLRANIDRKRREFGMGRDVAPGRGPARECRADMVLDTIAAPAATSQRSRAVLVEGGKGSGIVGHINPALTAEARSAYEGGRGSNQYRQRGSSKFERRPSGASDEERMADRFAERPAQRAQRIRSMKVDPVRAEIIRKAIGVRAALVG